MSDLWIIEGGVVCDDSSNTLEQRDVFIQNGVFVDSAPPNTHKEQRINATGMYLFPGLTDMHCHFRDPAPESSETVETGSAAAAAGGFTRILMMPNTLPPIDNSQTIEYIKQKNAKTGLIDVLISACLTKDRKGLEPADLKELKAAGAVALTDDGSTVPSTELLERIMISSADLGIPVLDHAMDPDTTGSGVIYDCEAASRLGLRTIPREAESVAIARDIALSKKTGCKMHIQHISTAEGVRLVGTARKEGNLNLTCEATPHHIVLSTADIKENDANLKMNPPLGTPNDKQAIIDALLDGTIEALATDHAPHPMHSKALGFAKAPFGVIGLETALASTYTVLVKQFGMSLLKWVALWNSGPSRILGLRPSSITPGDNANLCIFDPRSSRMVASSNFKSKARNTAFEGLSFWGIVNFTFRQGKMVFCR